MSDSSTAGGTEIAPGPNFVLKTQYIKDLSFENPKAPEVFQQTGQTPEVSINIDVRARPLQPAGDFEVLLSLNCEAKTADEPWFIVELAYAGVFSLAGVAENYVQPILFIEAPRLLFPFARNIVADTTRESGFPPLFLQPVDFAGLYQQKRAELQERRPA